MYYYYNNNYVNKSPYFYPYNTSFVEPVTNNTTLESSFNKKRLVQTIFDLIIIITVFVIYGFVFLMDPKILYFTCDQSDVFFPYKSDTIPFWAVGIYCTIGPIIIIVSVEILNAKLLFFQKKKEGGFRSFLICLFHAISLFALGIAITLLLTEIGKRWIGRLRYILTNEDYKWTH